jgi:hypothetical protein
MRMKYTIAKTAAMFFLVLILMSISAIAQSFSAVNIAILVASIVALNQCCGYMLKTNNGKEDKQHV